VLRLLTRLVLLLALGFFAPGEAAARVVTHAGLPDASAEKLVSWGSDPEAAVLRQAAALQAAEMQQGSASHSYESASIYSLAAENTSTAWNALNGPGPLGADVANTFRGASYTESALSEDTTLYRSYGGTAGELGPYWTRTPPAGPLQATMDSALNPAWGNTAQNVSSIVVPKGTTIYEGFAAPQGGLLGGGSQVYIPKVNPNWLVHP
jgi:hypothetical protein